jgi:hypothetical protein
MNKYLTYKGGMVEEQEIFGWLTKNTELSIGIDSIYFKIIQKYSFTHRSGIVQFREHF